ncbi:hypothetical protein DKX38_015626 [Salix brachista]|uniref:Reverse transcriptase Ty1/copia-type domain-containing protein n=1 Tax=Salix brachista TaxID=2182728 RepID=A0A5N5L5R3_9ROSI|nr:hypothetical protein DKX38_015626 [Salix brachista]
MAASKPVLTPLPTSPSLQSKSGTPLSNPTEYRTVVGSLQYLLITRPDIAFAVNKLSQYMHSPTSEHWIFVKRLLRYLCGTINDGLQLHRNSPLQMHAFTNHQHHEPVSQLMAYSDADWGGDKDDFSSTSAYIVYLVCASLFNTISMNGAQDKSYSTEELQTMLLEMARGFETSSWHRTPSILEEPRNSKRASVGIGITFGKRNVACLNCRTGAWGYRRSGRWNGLVS